MKRLTPLKAGVALFIVLLMVLGIMLISIHSTRSFLESTSLSLHTHKVFDQLAQLKSLLVDIETGQRGYLVANDESFLEPYHAAIASLQEQMRYLRNLMTNPGQQQRLETLIPLITDRVAFAQEAIALGEAGRFREARALVRTGRGKQKMDKIRELIKTLEDEEIVHLTQQIERTQAEGERSMAAVTWGSLLTLVLVTGAGVLLYFDVAGRRRAETAAATRAAQQAAIAELGILGLKNQDLDDLMNETITRVNRILGVEYAKILELLPDDSGMRLRAGIGWQAGLVGQAIVGLGPDSQAGYTLRSKEPVVVEDLRTDHRFRGPNLLQEHGVVSGISTVIGDPAQPWGVLGAHTSTRRTFTRDDVNFVQAAANLLAAAMQRTQAKNDLLESKARFRQIVENIPEVLWLTNPGMTEVYYVSPRYEEIWGQSCESVYRNPKAWLDAIHPEDRNRVVAMAEQTLGRLEGEYDEEFRILRPDGSIRWVRDRGFLIRDRAGNVSRIAGVAEDITERKQMEDSLRETNEILSALIDASPVAITILDPQGHTTLWNPAAERTFGWTRNDVLGKPLPTIPPNRKDEHRRFIDNVLNGQPFTDKEVVRQRKDGSLIPVSLSTAPLRSASSHIIGVMGLLTDISERKAAEDQLKWHGQIIDQIHDSVVSTDMDGYVKTWNKGAERLFGFTAEEAVGKHISFVYPDDQHEFMTQQVIQPLQAKGSHEVEVRMHRKGGEVFNAHLSLSLFLNADGVPIGMIGYSLDITDRKEAAERLAQSHEQLRALSLRLQEAQEEEQKRISREIHDELGQMLTGLKFDLSWLARRLDQAPPSPGRDDLHEKAHSLIAQADAIIQVVRRLATSLRPSALDDLGIFAALEWLTQNFQNQAGITCELVMGHHLEEIDPSVSTCVFRIIQEALTNVTRHAHATRATVHLDKQDEEHLWIRIIDNGCGIDPDVLKGRHTLGLLGMQERARSVGGTLAIRPHPNGGTLVEAHIPLISQAVDSQALDA